MKYLFAPFRFLYKVYFGLIYLVSGIILYPYFLYMVRGEDKYVNAAKVKKTWSNLLCFLIGIRVEISGLDNFPSKSPYIVCANHASYLDIVVMYKIIPEDFAFLGKAELLKWPIVNFFFKRGIDIPVYRDNRKKAAESINLAHEALRKGRNLAIFPEGKMQDNPPTPERFKNGAFSLAIEHDTPIVPIAFLNNYRLFSDHTDLFGAGRPGIAKVEILPFITPENGKDNVSLRNQIYTSIKVATGSGN